MKLPSTAPLALATTAALVAVSAIFARTPVQDAATGAFVSEVSVHRPMGYLLMAPVSNVLDTITLLSLRQHIAFGVTVLVVYAIWWWLVGRIVARTAKRRALREVARIGVGLVVLLALYAAATIMPRPMLQLQTVADVMAIDFHTHTRYSHDGRPDWRPQDVRQWHRDAGFDIAFVSDHRTFEGARDAWPNNPTRAGENTTLLPAIEVVWRGEHVNVLDADRMYQGILTENLRDIDEASLLLASAIPGAEPVLIETIPGDLSKMVAATGRGTAGVRAIEVIDGSPKGLGQGRRERAHIVHLADSLNLALVAGSDHHGWGHTASGWTLMSFPQWRALAPGQLTVMISNALRGGGRNSTKVVERYVANTESGLALPFTVPLVGWGMLRSLSPDERIVWLVWLAALYLGWRFLGARRRVGSATT